MTYFELDAGSKIGKLSSWVVPGYSHHIRLYEEGIRQSPYHRFITGIHCYRFRQDIVDWLEPLSVDQWYYYEDNPRTISFATKDLAMLFKLTFGGTRAISEG